MKTFFTALIFAAVALGLWYVFHHTANSVPAAAPQSTGNTTSTRPDIGNATFAFEDGSVTLKKDKAETTLEGAAVATETTLTDKVAYGDLNNDGKDDAAALLLQIGEGSGEFVYIAADISSAGTPQGTNALFVGDRINPQTLIIKNGLIILTYLDRTPDQSFADEPTTKVTKVYKVLDGVLTEE